MLTASTSETLDGFLYSKAICKCVIKQYIQFEMYTIYSYMVLLHSYWLKLFYKKHTDNIYVLLYYINFEAVHYT